jgi:hypothetical protein
MSCLYDTYLYDSMTAHCSAITRHQEHIKRTGLSCHTRWLHCHAQVLETSGAAVAEPLADALLSCGFTLELVVALVDADAGAAALQQELAQAQVGAALALSLPAPPPA